MQHTEPLRVSFNEVVEPLTPASERAFKNGLSAENRESQFVRCQGYGALKKLLSDYCEGRILGHSVLIGGHRGSGKTQLTHLAIECVQERLRKGFDRIPFVVSLHGGDLLCPARKPESSAVEHAVQQIVFGLHRSFADTILKRFASAAESNNAELTAQLTVQLNHHPGLAELRAAWSAAGLLTTGGVLQSGDPAQGPRELVALHTLDQAVRTDPRDVGISFDVPVSSKAEGKEEKVSLRVRHIHHLIRVLAPVLGVVIGLLAVYFSMGKVTEPLTRGLIFFSTTFIVNRFLQEFSAAGLDEALSEKNTLPDLDRLLPMMVRRVEDAGFAPIFVVEELDKIPDLAMRLAGFMRHLKYFVTDRAFFCFLTDRRYFEEFDSHLRRQPHPPEETFFGERILLHYTPQDFYAHLDRRLTVHTQTATQLSEAALFRRLLLFRSRVHPDLLRQAISANLGPDHIVMDDSLWRVFGYLLAVYMQIAVEVVYYDPSTQLRIRQKPEFSQWVLDTLYYPATTWEDGKATFSISRESLRQHLHRQIASVRSDGRTMAEMVSGEPSMSQGANGGVLFEDDLQFLWGKLNELVGLLSRPIQAGSNLLIDAKLLLDKDATDTATAALKLVICLVIPPAISAMEVEYTDVEQPDVTFHWRFDRLGNWLALFGDAQPYLREIQGGNLRSIAVQRFTKVLAWEATIQEIWPQFRYNTFWANSGSDLKPSDPPQHVTELPTILLRHIGDKVLDVVSAAEAALETDAWHLDRTSLRQLKRDFLQAILSGASNPPERRGTCKDDWMPPELTPSVQGLVEQFVQVGFKTRWDLLPRLHREMGKLYPDGQGAHG
jgi:hypothetical protein